MTSQNPVDFVTATPPTAVPSRRQNLLAWLVVAALIAVQYVLFVRTAQREITWFAPMGCDQCSYLVASYDVYQHVKSDGVLGGVYYGFGRPLPTGSLVHVLAPLVFLVAGPSRLAALTVNFLLFAALQCGLAGTLAWYTRRWSMAFLGLGLLLAASTPFFWPGGIYDFRLDFGAFCLYGLFACAVVRSRYFASRRWSVVVGLAAAILALFRHLTIVYLTGIFGICLIFVLARLVWNWRDPATRQLAVRQLAGGMAAGAVLAALVTPALLRKHDALWNYYVVGHFLGEEKQVRQAEAGVHNLLESYLFYIKSMEFHTGKHFLILAASCVLSGLALVLVCRRVPQMPGLPKPDAVMAVAFFGACLLVPYTVLTWDVAKSALVANILVVPLIWLALLPQLALARRWFNRRLLQGAMAAGALAALACGFTTQVQGHQHHTLFWTQNRAVAADILAIHDQIVRRSVDAGLERPRLSCDCIFEFLVAPVTSVWAFEAHGKVLPVSQNVGLGILLTDEAVIMDSIAHSDFVLLSTGSVHACEAYPFHQRMTELRPRMSAYCQKELVHVQSYRILDTTIDLYVRPAVASASGGPIPTGSKP